MIGPELDAELAYREERIRRDTRPIYPRLRAWLLRATEKDAAPGGADTPTPGPEVRRESKMEATT